MILKALMAIKFNFSLILIKSEIDFIVEHDLDIFKNSITLIIVEKTKFNVRKCNIFGGKKVVEDSNWFENMLSILTTDFNINF